MAPAARSFLTTVLSYFGVLPRSAREPAVVGIPSSAAVPILSLMCQLSPEGSEADSLDHNGNTAEGHLAPIKPLGSDEPITLPRLLEQHVPSSHIRQGVEIAVQTLNLREVHLDGADAGQLTRVEGVC